MLRVLKTIIARPVRAIGLPSIAASIAASTTIKSCFIAGVFQVTMIGLAAAYYFPSPEIPFYLLPSSRLGVIELSIAEPFEEPLIETDFTLGSPIRPADVLVEPSKASIGRRQFVRSESPRTAAALELAQLPRQRAKRNQSPIAQRPKSQHDQPKRSAASRRVVRRQSRAATHFVSVPMATVPRHLVSWSDDFSNNRPPEYPATARVQGWQGVVELSVTITAEGRVNDVQITQSSGHAVLDASAINAVRAWRVEPPMMGQQAVAITAPLRIRFELPQPSNDK